MFAEIASLNLQAVGVGSNLEKRKRASNLALALTSCWNGTRVPTACLKDICDALWFRRERLQKVAGKGEAGGNGILNAKCGILHGSQRGSLFRESVDAGDCDVVKGITGVVPSSPSDEREAARQLSADSADGTKQELTRIRNRGVTHVDSQKERKRRRMLYVPDPLPVTPCLLYLPSGRPAGGPPCGPPPATP